jgi:hypothetical protein
MLMPGYGYNTNYGLADIHFGMQNSSDTKYQFYFSNMHKGPKHDRTCTQQECHCSVHEKELVKLMIKI